MNLICLIDLNISSHFGVSLQMFAYLTAICNKCINKNTKNWYTIDALGAIFAIFTILLQTVGNVDTVDNVGIVETVDKVDIRDAKSNKNSRDKFLTKKISTKKWPKNDPK